MQCVRKGLQRADSRGCVSRYKLVFPGGNKPVPSCGNGNTGVSGYAAYIRAMRRLHQKIFYIQLDEQCVNIKEPIAFDFEYLTPVIQCFFEEGMEIMEIGALLHRGFLPDGSPDMYTDSFTCMMDKNLKFDTLEGYVHTVKLVQALASYLKKHGWEKKILFHIHDEPDIHVKNRISGFLHWGFNQFPGGMDPFKGTSCPNDTGIGTAFPCGDSFLVYPGKEGPEISMRLEAQRRGAEDAALWGLLLKKDPQLHDRLLDQMFTNNYTYSRDPEKFDRVYTQLLESLEKYS